MLEGLLVWGFGGFGDLGLFCFCFGFVEVWCLLFVCGVFACCIIFVTLVVWFCCFFYFVYCCCAAFCGGDLWLVCHCVLGVLGLFVLVGRLVVGGFCCLLFWVCSLLLY